VANPAFPNCKSTLGSQGETIMQSSHQLSSSTHTPVQGKIILDLQNAIRLRALELYEQRGRKNGYHLDDWLQAEAELTQRRTKMVAA
jgi:hypothetical protein